MCGSDLDHKLTVQEMIQSVISDIEKSNAANVKTEPQSGKGKSLAAPVTRKPAHVDDVEVRHNSKNTSNKMVLEGVRCI